MKYISALLLGVLFVTSLTFAAGNYTNATVSSISSSKWEITTGNNVVLEYGNLSEISISANTTTYKWAGLFGAVDGGITLADGSNNYSLYSWAWDPSSGGAVCASTSSNFNFPALNSSDNSSLGGLMTGWNTGDIDSAVNIFVPNVGSPCDQITIAGVAGMNTSAVSHTGGGATGTTCMFNDDHHGALSDYAFCSIITDGSNLAGSDYELMLPVDYMGTETYYFYAQLHI